MLFMLAAIMASVGLTHSASIVSAGREILQTTPLPKAASRVYAKISAIIKPVRIKFPENQSVDTIKAAVREGVIATTTAAAVASSSQASEKYGLTIEANVDDPKIRIMNITPKYKDGIELRPGDYEIFVEAEGYRSKRFWIALEDESNQDNEVNLDVNLNRLGLPRCTEKVTIENYAGAFDSTGGNIVQFQAVFDDVNINDLYQSYAKETKDINFMEVIDTVVFPDYVEFRIATPTSISGQDMENNRLIEIDGNRFVMNRVMFEQEGSDVRFTQQQFMPPGVFITDMNKEVLCEYTFNF